MMQANVIMDATRLANNKQIVLKRIKASSQEVEIAQFLSSPALASDPKNHSIPVLETIYHPDEDIVFLVMPMMLPMSFLPFRRLGEFTEAGLQFMHDHNIAHRSAQSICKDRSLISSRDPCFFNLMVDGSLIPGGFHFHDIYKNPDGVTSWETWNERRSVKSLRYYYIDFGLSRRYPTNVGVLDVGILGQDQSYPELSATIPYDPFKTDIYQLGNVILRMVDEYDGMEEFSTIGEAMTRTNPEDRVSLPEALLMVDSLKFKPRKLKRRVWTKDTPKFIRFLVQYFGYNFPL
ncbi:hypothetical protein H0H93_012124 [Arthromyces matolae]|nr:hypothetical protein H0H93_012124 [Arthromyces matolae]